MNSSSSIKEDRSTLVRMAKHDAYGKRALRTAARRVDRGTGMWSYTLQTYQGRDAPAMAETVVCSQTKPPRSSSISAA